MPTSDVRPRTRRLAVGVVLALLLAACGSTTSSDGVAFPSPDADAAGTEGAEASPTDATTNTPPPSPDAPTIEAPTSEATSPELIGPTEPPTPDLEDPNAPAPAPGGSDVTYQETPIVSTEGTPRAVEFETAEGHPDDAEVVVRWWSGVAPCTALADVEVIEDDDAVTITLHEASEHPDDAEVACIAIAEAKQHTVQLDAPLGGREIIDGAA